MTELAQLKEVKKKYGAMLRELANVTGVGIGAKVSGSTETQPLALQVFVSQKVPLNQLAPEDAIPSELDGIPTDVVVMPQLSAGR